MTKTITDGCANCPLTNVDNEDGYECNHPENPSNLELSEYIAFEGGRPNDCPLLIGGITILIKK
jgi:hypothetical protein